MSFSTNECAFKQVSIVCLGRKFVGIQGFEYKKNVEKELIYGAGGKPIDINEGNERIEGSLKLLKYEVDMLNDAARKANYTDITSVPHQAISIVFTYQKNALSPVRTSSLIGVAITEMPFGLDQGAKNMQVTLPFIAMDLIEK